jgi:hypothetical protein
MLSFIVQKPLEVIYFDGSSAANKLYFGHQDSQDLIIWGKPRPDKVFAERERINALCDWAERFGLDGAVR